MPIPSYVIPDAGLAAARPAAGSPGRLYYSTDTFAFERDNGTGWETFSTAVAGAGLYISYCCVYDQKAQNTDGGGFTLGAWRTRDLNQEFDPDGIVAIVANQFVLDAGTYRCIISAPAVDVNLHQARLYNVTGAATLLTGTCEATWLGTASLRGTRSFVVGRFTVAGAQTLEVQHRSSGTQGVYGFGYASNLTVEIYTVAEFFKEQ